MNITYPPLLGNHIRILDVSVNAENSEPIYNFRVVPLENPPEYTAISYCWDNSTNIARIRFHNGDSLPLSQTLLDLFNSLRKKSSKFTVWIDAICINQEDTAEKEFQVPLMGKIYSRSTEVVVWLGKSDNVTKNAFRFMKREEKDLETRPEPLVRSSSFYNKIRSLYGKVSGPYRQESDLSGLKNMLLLLQRPWFQRVWVIQEVASGRSVQVVCGDDSVDLGRFSDGVSAIWNSFIGLGRYSYDHPAILGFWCVTRMLSIREEYQKKINEGESGVCYETLLQAAYHCRATRTCDKVFAFHGIADSRPVPKANYRITPEQVFVETAEALLCHGDSLDLLTLSWMGYMRQHSTLPTWAPDLRCHAYDEPLVLCNCAGWDAGGRLNTSPKIDPESSRRLRLQVKLIDTIDVVCPEFAPCIVKQQRAAVNSVLALRPQLAGDLSVEAWMNKLAESLIMGLDIDDNPLRVGMPGWDQHRRHFDDWLQWVQSSPRQKDLQNIESNVYHRIIRPRIDTMKAFATSRGFFGIGPEPTMEGDVVFIVPGCRIPLLLRPDPPVADDEISSPLVQTWTLVSWCYIDGLMFGEAMDLDNPVEEILLRSAVYWKAVLSYFIDTVLEMAGNIETIERAIITLLYCCQQFLGATFIFGTLDLALQSQACVTFTTKEDIKAQKYTWAVSKDGQKQCQFNGQGNRPNSLFGDVDDEDYYVILSNDFPTLHGQVFKYEYDEFQGITISILYLKWGNTGC
ncbi:heterokaryon incompatibility het-6 [Fusarium acutatum]|uniref:Heterokaryon incompatibility het-6 n=1 Tax=Fusarium acutatum TaxID=78861 RepID=A0A8H4JM86_9HYPO|nr:heterokaryon incompatibility het-6 [Fusarium acutatum]